MELADRKALDQIRAAEPQRRILREIARRKRLDLQCDEAEERLARIVRTGEDGVASQAAKVLLQCGGRLRGQENVAGADAFRALIARVRDANVRKGSEADIGEAVHIDVVSRPVASSPGGGGDTRSPRPDDDPLVPSPNFSGTGSSDGEGCPTKAVDPLVEAAVNAPTVEVDPADEEDAEGYGGLPGASGRVGKYFVEAVEDEARRLEGEYNAVENAVMGMGLEGKRRLLRKLTAIYGPKRERSEEAKARERARRRKVYAERKEAGNGKIEG